MTLLDAIKGKPYRLIGMNSQEALPVALSRRHIQLGDGFIFAGKVGKHYILKFNETRIGLHQTFIKDMIIEKIRD